MNCRVSYLLIKLLCTAAASCFVSKTHVQLEGNGFVLDDANATSLWPKNILLLFVNNEVCIRIYKCNKVRKTVYKV